MKIAVIGLGSIGTRHLNNLLALDESIDAAYVYDANPERLRADDLKNDRIIVRASFGEIAAEQVEAAFIFTPNSLHYEHALPFVKKGIPCFIEKPATITQRESDELLGLSSAPVVVGCNMRYHPAVRKAKELIENGTLGRILSVRAHAGHCLKNWRPGTDYKQTYSARVDQGGGVLLDGIHELDYLMSLFGHYSEYKCMYDNFGVLGIETEELAEILLRHENGIISSIHSDYLQTTKRRGLIIIGDKATYVWESLGKMPELMTLRLLKNNEDPEILFQGRYSDTNQLYLDMMNEVLEVIRQEKSTDETNLLTIEDASTEIKIIENLKEQKR
jgi:predicted dehydrogenase